jgi:ABC-2 type transport system permease protein
MNRWTEKRGRLLTLLWRESLALRRDRFTFFMLILAPLAQITLMSYTITTDFDHLPLAVLDRAHTRDSRALVQAIAATGYFTVLPIRDVDDVHDLLSRQRCRSALVIPANFSEALANNEEVRLGLWLDGSDTTISTSTEGFLTATVSAFYGHTRLERTPLTERNLRTEPVGMVTVARRVLFNPTLSGFAFMIPGLLGLIPMFATVMTTTLTVVHERDAGTFEQLLVTPVTPTEVILGKILPFAVVAMLATLFTGIVGWLAFDVTPVGNVFWLLLVTPIFLLLGLSLGLWMSSIAHSSGEAIERAVLIMVPQMMLSDAIFPLSLMGWPFRAISEIIPLTHFLRITRGVYLKGQSLDELWLEVVWLLGLLAVILVLAQRAIRKQV